MAAMLASLKFLQNEEGVLDVRRFRRRIEPTRPFLYNHHKIWKVTRRIHKQAFMVGEFVQYARGKMNSYSQLEIVIPFNQGLKDFTRATSTSLKLICQGLSDKGLELMETENDVKFLDTEDAEIRTVSMTFEPENLMLTWKCVDMKQISLCDRTLYVAALHLLHRPTYNLRNMIAIYRVPVRYFHCIQILPQSILEQLAKLPYTANQIEAAKRNETLRSQIERVKPDPTEQKIKVEATTLNLIIYRRLTRIERDIYIAIKCVARHTFLSGPFSEGTFNQAQKSMVVHYIVAIPSDNTTKLFLWMCNKFIDVFRKTLYQVLPDMDIGMKGMASYQEIYGKRVELSIKGQSTKIYLCEVSTPVCNESREKIAMSMLRLFRESENRQCVLTLETKKRVKSTILFLK